MHLYWCSIRSQIRIMTRCFTMTSCNVSYCSADSGAKGRPVRQLYTSRSQQQKHVEECVWGTFWRQLLVIGRWRHPIAASRKGMKVQVPIFTFEFFYAAGLLQDVSTAQSDSQLWVWWCAISAEWWGTRRQWSISGLQLSPSRSG